MIETVRVTQLNNIRAVMFDFDGTVGMIRAGWMPVMLDMMMETLAPLGSAEGLRQEAEDYVARFTGRDTIEQMIPFVAQVARLGGTPESAEDYKSEFLRRLNTLRLHRLEGLRSGQTRPEALMVPGVRHLLESIAEQGISMFLASGSPHEEIMAESRLLKIDSYFTEIHGSSAGTLTKQQLLARIVGSGIPGAEILTFGDGTAEIEATKHVGGVAVGVASDEPECLCPDPKKRAWLIAAGADYIVPNYLHIHELRHLLTNRVRH